MKIDKLQITIDGKIFMQSVDVDPYLYEIEPQRILPYEANDLISRFETALEKMKAKGNK